MPDNLFDLTGKVALITGSTKGIGKATAYRMAQHGAKVVVSSRKADAVQAVTDEINADFPGAAIGIPCNIGYKDQLQRLVDETRQQLGKIDVLVCNAAINPFAGSMADMPDEAFDKIMASNVKSNIWLCNMVIPEMKERRDGSIIIISSIGGMHGQTLIGAYGISKAADIQIVRNIAAEYGEYNIRANAICPGLVKTDFARYLWDTPEILKKSTSNAPLGRIGEPDEIAGMAVLLAGKAGAFATGQSYIFDGGVMAA